MYVAAAGNLDYVDDIFFTSANPASSKLLFNNQRGGTPFYGKAYGIVQRGEYRHAMLQRAGGVAMRQS